MIVMICLFSPLLFAKPQDLSWVCTTVHEYDTIYSYCTAIHGGQDLHRISAETTMREMQATPNTRLGIVSTLDGGSVRSYRPEAHHPQLTKAQLTHRLCAVSCWPFKVLQSNVGKSEIGQINIQAFITLSIRINQCKK